MSLKYLFEAYTDEGHVIKQTQADVSYVDPSKSSWYDVLMRRHQIVLLVLVDSVKENAAEVNLLNGEFMRQGGKFSISPAGALDHQMKAGGKYLPQYYRRCELLSDGTRLPDRYAIGWDYVIDGEIIATQVIMID